MSVRFEIDGMPAVLALLDDAEETMRNPSAGLRRIGEDLLVSNESRLARGVDVDGRPFDPPSRRVQQSGGQTMVDDANLLGSLNYDVARKDLELFSSDIRAAVHWEGKTIKAKNASGYLTIVFADENGDLQFRKVREVKMPERKWMGISDGDLDDAAETLGNRIVGGAR